MRSIFRIQLLLIIVLIAGCGGGSDPINVEDHQLVVGNITGPNTLDENTSVSFSITASGDTGIVYSWTVDPSGAGILTNQSSATSTYRASAVDADTGATIRVAVNSDHSSTIVRNIAVTIQNTDVVIPGDAPHAIAYSHPPITVPDGAVRFRDDGSLDPDGGSIILYEWDWENDGVFDETGTEVEHSWPSLGTYHVQFRVTDDEGATDTLEEPIEVRIDQGWAVTWGSGDYATGMGVAVGDDGTVHVAGEFRDAIDLDPGPGEDPYFFDEGAYLSYFEPDGTYRNGFAWGRYTAAEEGAAYCREVAVDSAGNVYVCGLYQGDVDFDPGMGALVCGNPGGGYGYYVVGFDPYGFLRSLGYHEGYYLYNSSYRYTIIEYYAMGVAIDGGDNVYSAIDYYYNTRDGELETIKHYAQLHSWNPDGTRIKQEWQFGGFYSNFSGPVQNVGEQGHAVDVAVTSTGTWFMVGLYDERGHLGIYNDTWPDFTEVTFGTEDKMLKPSAVCVNTAGYGYVVGPPEQFLGSTSESFLRKFDSDGNLELSIDWGGIYDTSVDVVVDSVGDIYIVGDFKGTVDFDVGPDVHEVTSSGGWDVFILKLDPTGTSKWVRTIGGPDVDFVRGITLDSNGIPYITGYFIGSADLDPTDGEEIHTSWSGADAFVIKLLPNGEFK